MAASHPSLRGAAALSPLAQRFVLTQEERARLTSAGLMGVRPPQPKPTPARAKARQGRPVNQKLQEVTDAYMKFALPAYGLLPKMAREAGLHPKSLARTVAQRRAAARAAAAQASQPQLLAS